MFSAGMAVGDVTVRHEFDMAYQGQTHTVTVDAPDPYDRGPTGVQAAFDRANTASFETHPEEHRDPAPFR